MSRASSKLRIQSTRNTQLFLFKSFHNFEPFKLASTPAQAFINIFITSLILVSTGRDHLELSWTVIRIHFQAPAIFGKEQEGSCVTRPEALLCHHHVTVMGCHLRAKTTSLGSCRPSSVPDWFPNRMFLRLLPGN